MDNDDAIRLPLFTGLPQLLMTTKGSASSSFWPILSMAEGLKLSTRLFSTTRKLFVRVTYRERCMMTRMGDNGESVTWSVCVEWMPTSVRGGRLSGQTKASASSSAPKFGDRIAEPSSWREFTWYLGGRPGDSLRYLEGGT